MRDVEFSQHARDVLVERAIPEIWVSRTLEKPDNVWEGPDGNTHFAGAIAEHDGRILHVVVNMTIVPGVVVTVFFDRRLARRNKA